MGHRTNSSGYSERQRIYTIPNPTETVLVADTVGRDGDENHYYKREKYTATRNFPSTYS